MPIQPVIPIRKFDDVARDFKTDHLTLAEITGIADETTVHYGFNRALECVRVQLGEGKWAYVQAVEAVPLRAAWDQWKAENPAAPAKPTVRPSKLGA